MLINDGLDCHDNNAADPDHWWDVYNKDFGSALGDRYMWQGAIRRDFTTAVILVNEPGGYTLTLNLGETLTTYDGTVYIVKNFKYSNPLVECHFGYSGFIVCCYFV